MRKPDFDNILKILKREKPSRPTLFEFFLNHEFYLKLADPGVSATEEGGRVLQINAYKNAGYDYVTMIGSDFHFPSEEVSRIHSKSLNDGAMITDEKSFLNYKWPDPESVDNTRFDRLAPYLTDGMKFMVHGPNGVLENAINLVGYDNICIMAYEEPELLDNIFTNIGERLVRYYDIHAANPLVGACISNDDWGFNTQTMLSPEQMRRYVFPWHKKIVDIAHKHNKPVILHSCGNMRDIIGDFIELGYDAKHSYEDNIMPVEEAYDLYSDHFAILGGIDVDFICRETPQNIKKRCEQMLAKAEAKGAYALGTGNSVPHYVPFENYMAMIECSRI